MEDSLKELREKKLLSQRDVINLMGTRNKDKISLLENGKIHLEFSEAVKLSSIFGVTLEELFQAYRNSKKENGKDLKIAP